MLVDTAVSTVEIYQLNTYNKVNLPQKINSSIHGNFKFTCIWTLHLCNKLCGFLHKKGFPCCMFFRALFYWWSSNLQGIYFKIIFSKTWSTWHVISIIGENSPHAHDKTHLHTVKVYIALPSKFCSLKILLFFDHWSIHFFQSKQCFQAIEFVDWPILEKLYIFQINLPYN